MKMGLAQEEFMYENNRNPMQNSLIPTCRFNEIASPQLSVVRETGSLPEAPELGFRLPMDFQDDQVVCQRGTQKQ